MATVTLAVAGHAPNSARNIGLLLSDWLDLGAPDADGDYLLPARYSGITVYALLTEGVVPPGLKPALKILPYIDTARFEIFTDRANAGEVAAWTPLADAVHESADPYEALITALGATSPSRLLINWLDTDADDERLVQLAHQHGKIKVLDLVEGLVEIVPDEPDDDPGAEAEPEAEPEAPVKAAPVAGSSLDEVPESLDDVAVAPERAPTPEPPALPAGPVQTTLPVADSYTLPRELTEQIYGALVVAADYHNFGDCMAAIRDGNAVDKAPRSALTQELTNVGEMLRAVLYGEVPYADSVPNAAAPKKAGGKLAKVIWDDTSNEWRRAGRGRVRVGTRVGMMDEQGNVTEAA